MSGFLQARQCAPSGLPSSQVGLGACHCGQQPYHQLGWVGRARMVLALPRGCSLQPGACRQADFGRTKCLGAASISTSSCSEVLCHTNVY